MGLTKARAMGACRDSYRNGALQGTELGVLLQFLHKLGLEDLADAPVNDDDEPNVIMGWVRAEHAARQSVQPGVSVRELAAALVRILRSESFSSRSSAPRTSAGQSRVVLGSTGPGSAGPSSATPGSAAPGSAGPGSAGRGSARHDSAGHDHARSDSFPETPSTPSEPRVSPPVSAATRVLVLDLSKSSSGGMSSSGHGAA
mmetsp:Transcript_6328/g.13985  ORF Transcript_6328/g.13985 Transcript_6328/m.13985 type:complete len:201 (+) Transcript_6328:88-690(+)|eukprot:CAMPEP_0202898234 /NCGR_PEP_ID=MMETSP1392-20130828/6809_1 /ASSEMBLY_ACC=CAM_ASM_000868 /TAXON_ID=225041 /ORGANISM="Chlamydomonas chlamydogama, Strain SAG 11-48b" /LENGTH=200 /DNA_ID=CAMNT_0049584105 /DNA_START=85 /DNA_END=687 /DNA_ORIENTATION=-